MLTLILCMLMIFVKLRYLDRCCIAHFLRKSFTAAEDIRVVVIRNQIMA